jgi:putative oxidoreductase
MLHILLQPIPFAQLMTSLFLAILFLQSGLDKVFNFADNLGWLTGHFSKTPFRSQVKMMLITITIAEVAAGVLALMGAGQIALNGEKTFAMYGAQLATLDIVMLFFGQRIAKDYAGAASLVPYFILCVGQVFLLCIGSF